MMTRLTMKPIHFILICCLLGLIGCSKEEVSCDCVTTKRYNDTYGEFDHKTITVSEINLEDEKSEVDAHYACSGHAHAETPKVVFTEDTFIVSKIVRCFLK